MARVEDLKAHEGRILRLAFEDGHVVVAFLIDVDADHVGTELTYEPLDVESWGSVDQSAFQPDAVAAGSLSALRSFGPAERPKRGPIWHVSQVLAPVLANASHEVLEFSGRREFRFTPPPGADYRFEIHAYRDGEAHLSASLVGERPAGEYFWYVALELPDFGSTEELADELLKRAQRIMAHPSRIRQSRGWVLWTFHAEYEENGEWSGVGGVSALKWGFRPPKIQVRERMYFSPPLFG